MGNNNSGHVGIQQPPPPWTQSLPRDVHRAKKYGAVQQGQKVLPERIPGQRLRPTENGRNLQTQGTISPRKMAEIAAQSPNYPPQIITHHHSSMTALNHAPHQVPVSMYPPNAGSYHDLRFGYPPNKSFTSEPDLRGNSPSSHISMPVSPSMNLPHLVMPQSPTKGKMKSKKRHKAPPPPHPLQASISFPLERPHSVPSPISAENWSTASSPTPKNMKLKPKKMGLFKKKSETRMSKYDVENIVQPQNSLHATDYDRGGEERLKHGFERSISPVPLKISSKKELKERARSLDNLQHEIRRSPKELAASLHNLEVIGSVPPENGRPRYKADQIHHFSDSSDSRRCSTIERDSRSKSKERMEARGSTTLDRESKSHRRMSNVERRLYERQLEERRLGERVSSPIRGNKRTESTHNRMVPDYRRSSSSCSSHKETYDDKPLDEWDKAEEEYIKRKLITDNLQKEILNATKNLRKSPTILENTKEAKVNLNHSNEQFERSAVHVTESEIPKTFFFGMEPETPNQRAQAGISNNFGKLSNEEEVKINGTTVEYSRHSLRPKEKKKTLERDNWNRSLDYRERTRSRSRERDLEDGTDQVRDKKKLSRKIGEFAATIERAKSQRIHSPEELSNSISRKGDGGYHSRQNSGSVHLDTEGSDEDNMIRMNLRPTLPRRQLELPRFSPNAAWRSLSVESPSRQKELYSEIINEDVFNISEDRIHRFTRPTAPPRGSGEKSADSGISGDAGSPGPIQEFEPLTPEKLKSSSGPLAVSSPVVSSRLDAKRTWIPAQDLDDNSFEEPGDPNGKSSMQQEVTTLPKLTSRTNMFTMAFQAEDMPGEDEVDFGRKYHYKEVDSPNDKDLKIKERIVKNVISTEVPRNMNSLQRTRLSVPYAKDSEEVRKQHKDENIQEDVELSWRENWSMSKSIPNSLNTCEEPDAEGNPNRPCRSRSESRMSVNNVQLENKAQLESRPITPSYLQRGNNGHIMYLPEYKSYQIDKKQSEDLHSPLSRDTPTTLEQERKLSSGDVNHCDLETGRSYNQARISMTPVSHDNAQEVFRSDTNNGKKHKKFSYQSTVRILEKKKLEEKLSKEADEKEKRRLREVEAMMKVEQEFQMKREREKKRLKKQLQLYQEEQSGQHVSPQHAAPQHAEPQHVEHNLSSSSEDKGFSSPSYEHYPLEGLDSPSPFSDRSHKPLQSSKHPPPFQSGYVVSSPYQSLPMELHGSPSAYETRDSHTNQQGLFSGLKKWVRGKKEPRSGYQSDTSSVTVTSTSRQEPDGAPAASSTRKSDIRAEIIAASRHRNGVIILDSDHPSNKSPATSVASSHRRPYTPDFKRTTSPDSRKSLSSEPLTQELPEMRQEQRQYREYRSSKKMLISNMFKGNNKASPISHNYRRDFCLGSQPLKVVHPHADDIDKHSRHSNESRKSKQSLTSSKRCSSTDFFVPHDNIHRHYSSSKPPIPAPQPGFQRSHFDSDGRRPLSRIMNVQSSPPINSSPARYTQGMVTPFNPGKGYRPVSFSPPPSGKILTVT